MNQIRVLFVTTGLGTGGAEHMLCKIIEAINSRQVAFMVVSLRDEGDFGSRLRAAGVPVICCRLPKIGALSAFWGVIRQIKAFNPDVVQGWMYHGCLAASLFSKYFLKKPPVVWGIRQTLYDLAKERVLTGVLIRLQARLSGSVARILYNSELARAQHRAVGFSDRFDEIVPNGFDLSRYRPDQDRRRGFRKMYEISDQEVVIGLVARLHPMKDHRSFIQAAAIIAAQIPKARFVLAGSGTNWPSISKMLIEANISNRTLCLGRVESTENIYPGLDLLVLSSAWGEGWPNVLGEAMACGVPCVATDVGASADIVRGDGRIVPPSDPVALADACIDLLSRRSNNETQTQCLRESILKRFSINVITDKYEEIWRQLVSVKSGF